MPYIQRIAINHVSLKLKRMKITPSFLFLITALTILPTMTAIGAEKDSPAAIQMKQIGKSFKTLSTQISDPAKKDSSLQIVDAMQNAVNAARLLIPAPAAKLQGDSLKTYMREYAKGLDELDANLQDLKKAISSGDTSASQGLLETITKLKKTYHSDLR